MTISRNPSGWTMRHGLLAGAATAALAASPAFGQTADAGKTAEVGKAADAAQVSEVVVTSQFREQRLQDTPLAVTAVSGAQLEARGQASVIDISNQAPNVTLRPATAIFGPSIQAFIRGVGQYDSSYAFEPGVGLYIDDVYFPTLTGSIVDLVDLDRVEVLRGPQGTLSGQNSVGGSIKIFSKKPTGSGGGFVQATYGRFNRMETRGAMDIALVPDKLFARITASGMSKDGYVTRYDYACTHPGTTVPSFQGANANCKLGTLGGKSYAAGRAALRWIASDRVEVNMTADYSRDTSEAAPTTLLFVGNQAGVPGVPNASSAFQIGGVALGNATGSPFITSSPYGAYAQDSFSRSPYVSYATFTSAAPRDGTAPYSIGSRNAIEGYGASGHIDYRFSDNLSLKSITSARHYVTRYAFDEGTPIDTALIDNYDKLSQFSQEVRLSGEIADAVNFTVGGFYFRYNGQTRQRVNIPQLQFVENDFFKQRTKAAFANVDWEVAPGLNLIGGVRYTDASKTVTYGREGIPGSIFGGQPDPRVASLNGVVGKFAGDHWDYRGVVQYRWSPTVMTYAQLSTGFTIGGVNPRAFFPAQALPFGPEKLMAYEVGLKTDLFDRRVRLNLSSFYNKYKDILVVVSTCPLPGAPPAPCALPVNAGEANVKGAEAETTIRLAPGLTLEGSLAYLDFEYTSLSAAAISSGVKLNMRGPSTPKWQYSTSLQYDHEMESGAHLIPRLDLAHTAAFFQQASNSPFNRVPGRTLLNALVTWRAPGEDWSVVLAATNLTNKLYYNSVFDNRGSNNTVVGNPGAPREWSVTVKRSF